MISLQITYVLAFVALASFLAWFSKLSLWKRHGEQSD